MDTYGFRVQDLHTCEDNSKYMSMESNGHYVTLPSTLICLYYLFVKNPLVMFRKQPSKVLQQPEERVICMEVFISLPILARAQGHLKLQFGYVHAREKIFYKFSEFLKKNLIVWGSSKRANGIANQNAKEKT